MTAVETTAHRHAVFHQLRVQEVEQLTDDAVALTFPAASVAFAVKLWLA